MKNIKTAVFFSLCVLLLYTACPHNERPGPGINPGSQDSAPYVEGGISLVVSRDKKTININVKSSNGKKQNHHLKASNRCRYYRIKLS